MAEDSVHNLWAYGSEKLRLLASRDGKRLGPQQVHGYDHGNRKDHQHECYQEEPLEQNLHTMGERL